MQSGLRPLLNTCAYKHKSQNNIIEQYELVIRYVVKLK